MTTDEVTPGAMRAEARRLEEEAALLERFAADRYDDSARLYRGGSSTFVRSIDVADGYRREARAMRAEAANFREIADFYSGEGDFAPGGSRRWAYEQAQADRAAEAATQKRRW